MSLCLGLREGHIKELPVTSDVQEDVLFVLSKFKCYQELIFRGGMRDACGRCAVGVTPCRHTPCFVEPVYGVVVAVVAYTILTP